MNTCVLDNSSIARIVSSSASGFKDTFNTLNSAWINSKASSSNVLLNSL